VVKELMESLRLSIEAGEDPPVGRTTKPVTGFRGRSGRSFRAKLRLEKSEDGKWRVEFDEDWARGGAQPPREDGAGDDGAPEGEQQPQRAEPVTSE
jgi:DNA topoisomerase III